MSAVDLAPGTRVRHELHGWTGTVDHDAVDARTRRDYPTLVPVQWDGDDASLTSAKFLEVVEEEPAASAEVVDVVPGATRRPGFVSSARPSSSLAGLASGRVRLGGPVAEPPWSR